MPFKRKKNVLIAYMYNSIDRKFRLAFIDPNHKYVETEIHAKTH